MRKKKNMRKFAKKYALLMPKVLVFLYFVDISYSSSLTYIYFCFILAILHHYKIWICILLVSLSNLFGLNKKNEGWIFCRGFLHDNAFKSLTFIVRTDRVTCSWAIKGYVAINLANPNSLFLDNALLEDCYNFQLC